MPCSKSSNHRRFASSSVPLVRSRCSPENAPARKWLVGVAKVLKKEKKLPRTRTYRDGDGFDLAPLRNALKAEGMM